ncbi:MAG: leucine-rich repeat protein [Anaerobutyricum soehngenii]
MKGCLTRNVQIVVGNYQDTNQSGFVGGIAGCVDNSGSIEYCGREEGSLTSWYQGTESSGSYLGGIVGVIYRSTMNNCWSFKTGGTSTDNADYAKNQKIGSFVGLCSNLKSKNNIIYSGTDAETSSVSRVTFSNKQQGDGPQVLQKEDFNCSQVGFEGAGYLTNADSTGNPLRLHPIEMKLYTDTVKKGYYYGENLELNGLRIQLRRGNVGMLGVKLYNVNTDYNAKKAGNYQVKISVGNLNSKFEVTVANKPHTYEQQSITPATCTTEGSVSYKCKDAGCNEVLSSVLSALGHKMEHHKGKQATCKEDGEKEYWYCTRCKKYFLDEKGTKETTKAGLVISATGHKMEHHDRKEATNEQAGNIEYWYCTLCNNYFLDEKGKQQVEKDKVVISILPVIPDSGKDSDKNNSSTNTTQKKILTKGTSLSDQKTGAVYEITMEGKEVSYKKQSTKKKKIVIPDQVTINGYTYKVTSIADNAFKNNKNITTVIIGKNIKRIGKKAFYGCKSLRNITIKTKLLKKNTVGSKAFTKAGSKNYKKLKVKVPKKKLKLYKKILRKKGLSKKAKMR